MCLRVELIIFHVGEGVAAGTLGVQMNWVWWWGNPLNGISVGLEKRAGFHFSLRSLPRPFGSVFRSESSSPGSSPPVD